MRILLDHGVPARLRDSLRDHTVATAYEMGWAGLDNGTLLISTEAAFDALVTRDQNLRYQQNLAWPTPCDPRPPDDQLAENTGPHHGGR